MSQALGGHIVSALAWFSFVLQGPTALCASRLFCWLNTLACFGRPKVSWGIVVLLASLPLIPTSPTCLPVCAPVYLSACLSACRCANASVCPPPTLPGNPHLFIYLRQRHRLPQD